MPIDSLLAVHEKSAIISHVETKRKKVVNMRKKTEAMVLAMMTVVGVSSAFTTPPVEAGIINAPYEIQENQKQKVNYPRLTPLAFEAGA